MEAATPAVTKTRCKCQGIELVHPVLGRLVGWTTEGETHTADGCGKQIVTIKR